MEKKIQCVKCGKFIKKIKGSYKLPQCEKDFDANYFNKISQL